MYSLPDEKLKVEVINLRNTRLEERAHVASVSLSQHGSRATSESLSQTSIAIEALGEQVETIRNTVVLLEQRLTVLEEELKN